MSQLGFFPATSEEVVFIGPNWLDGDIWLPDSLVLQTIHPLRRSLTLSQAVNRSRTY